MQLSILEGDFFVILEWFEEIFEDAGLVGMGWKKKIF